MPEMEQNIGPLRPRPRGEAPSGPAPGFALAQTASTGVSVGDGRRRRAPPAARGAHAPLLRTRSLPSARAQRQVLLSAGAQPAALRRLRSKSEKVQSIERCMVIFAARTRLSANDLQELHSLARNGGRCGQGPGAVGVFQAAGGRGDGQLGADRADGLDAAAPAGAEEKGGGRKKCRKEERSSLDIVKQRHVSALSRYMLFRTDIADSNRLHSTPLPVS